MRDYLREQTAGTIIRNTFAIFLGNFWPLFPIYIIPIFPFATLQAYADRNETDDLSLLAGSLLQLVALLIFPAIMVAVSDVCLGNRPSIWRSYRRIWTSLIWKLIGAYLLSFVIFVAAPLLMILVALITAEQLMWVALVLAVFPGMMFVAWFMLMGPVVVFENVGGSRALSRSKQLGRGFFVRNLAVLLLSFIVALVSQAVVAGLVYAAFLLVFGESMFSDALLALLSHGFGPLYLIANVLIYYDMRIRKEAYNNVRLTEDLRT